MKLNVLFALGLVLLATPLYAQEAQQVAPIRMRDANGEIKYSVEESYVVPASKSNSLMTATNVVIKEVPFSVLPSFVSAQAQMIARDCTGNIDNTADIKYYRYVSDYTRDKGFAPNFIFDLSGLAAKDQKSCILGHACADHECLLIGYQSAGTEAWGTSFVTKQHAWTHREVQSTAKNAKPSDKLTLLRINAQAFCPPREDGHAAPDAATDARCMSDQIWQETGLSAYAPVPVLDEPAPSSSEAPAVTNTPEVIQNVPGTPGGDNVPVVPMGQPGTAPAAE